MHQRDMKEVSFKFTIAILTFVIGIACAAVWLIYPHSLNQVLEISSSHAVVVEEVEEYAVYSAAINELYIKEDSARLVVISNQTSFFGDERHKGMFGDGYITAKSAEQRVHFMKENFPSVNEETLFDYDSKMMKPHKLHNSFNLSSAYRFTNKDIYEEDRVIRLSKVGFNSEGNEAFVYIEFMCKVMCDRSDYLLLEKVNGIWTVKEIFRGLHS